MELLVSLHHKYKPTNMKTFITQIILILTLSHGAIAQSQGEIRGQLKDDKGIPVGFAAVVIYSGETQIAATTTNEKGYYVVKPLNAGTYTVKFQHLSYQPLTVMDVVVGAQQSKYIDESLTSLAHEIGPVIIIAPVDEIIDKGKIPNAHVIPPIAIKQSLFRDVKDFVATAPGIVQKDDGQKFNIRGSREDATQYVVDGIKMIGGFSIPKSAIQEITVLSGSIPAQFGDATGGIVIITTKSFFGK